MNYSLKTCLSEWVLSHSVVSNSLCPHELCPPGCSVHGIFQARGLEWADISSSRGSSQSREICLVVLNYFPFFYSLIEVEILTSSIKLTWGPHNPNNKLAYQPRRSNTHVIDKLLVLGFISYMNPTVLVSFLHVYSCSDFQ